MAGFLLSVLSWAWRWVSVLDKEVGCDYFFNPGKNLGSWDSPPCHEPAETDPSPYHPLSQAPQDETERPFPSTPGSLPAAATELREIAGLQHPDDISVAIIALLAANEARVAGLLTLYPFVLIFA